MNIRSFRQKKQQGFSLIELLVVMFIFTLMTGIMIPLFTQKAGFNDVRLAAEELRNSILNAESRSISEPVPAGWATSWYYLNYQDENNYAIWRSSEPSLTAAQKEMVPGSESGISANIKIDRATSDYIFIKEGNSDTVILTPAGIAKNPNTDLGQINIAARGIAGQVATARITLNPRTGRLNIDLAHGTLPPVTPAPSVPTSTPTTKPTLAPGQTEVVTSPVTSPSAVTSPATPQATPTLNRFEIRRTDVAETHIAQTATVLGTILPTRTPTLGQTQVMQTQTAVAALPTPTWTKIYLPPAIVYTPTGIVAEAGDFLSNYWYILVAIILVIAAVVFLIVYRKRRARKVV